MNSFFFFPVKLLCNLVVYFVFHVAWCLTVFSRALWPLNVGLVAVLTTESGLCQITRFVVYANFVQKLSLQILLLVFFLLRV